MIRLPEKFKIKIINRYSDEGKKWLDSIDSIVSKYTEKFKLTNIKLIDELTMNIVFFATSKIYGEVVIKILASKKGFISETNYMKICNSKYLVKCYYSNLEDRIILLKRIIPGENLSTLKDRNERIEIFCDILNDLNIENISNNNIRSFDDVLKEKISFIIEDKDKYSNIIYLAYKAIDLNNELKKMNLPIVILHNDLHHKNILKSANYWKVIDPVGITGYKVLDLLQFIRYELEIENRDLSKLHEIITLVSKYTNHDVLLIYKSLFVYSVDKLIFYIKSKASKTTITYNTNFLNAILTVLNKS